MILARALSADSTDTLELGFARMGLPTGAAEYVLEKLPHLQVLLTGLSVQEGRFLRGMAEASTAPGHEELPLYVPGDQKLRPGSALLAGRKEQLERLSTRARAGGLSALADAVGALLRSRDPLPAFEAGGRQFPLGERTYVVGVVNITPDSFSDGGRFFDPKDAVAHGLALVQAGADILDIGGESTRPGAAPVEADEELRRILPVITALRENT